MARPEKEPKTPLAKRLRDVRRELGDPERAEVAENLGVSVSTLAFYERGESEPTASVLAVYRVKYGINLEWLITGQGPMRVGANVRIENVSLADIRSFLWNICETYYEKLPRRTKPAAFADQCLAMFDYLLTREDVKTEAAAEVIEFGAEQLKRASGRDEP
ncbi:helix-turn-helix domain-containing protein [Roseibium aggregatum]|uniref:helix-turn-helix domain-containing protein n=1 Tax=Roseibium aggregatum TaxID=187304 RepID=UPI001E42692B|nr:helix-turn-helix transcriptional regulator [Roseibium aggregatum]UES58540.1 helix-turn-helix domain-containing protein [Roseibium aggregatum]